MSWWLTHLYATSGLWVPFSSLAVPAHTDTQRRPGLAAICQRRVGASTCVEVGPALAHDGDGALVQAA